MNNQFTWLHIGLGSFHRAHQAWYLHRLIASGDNRWRIAAGNIPQRRRAGGPGAGGAGRTLRPRDRQPGRGARI